MSPHSGSSWANLSGLSPSFQPHVSISPSFGIFFSHSYSHFLLWAFGVKTDPTLLSISSPTDCTMFFLLPIVTPLVLSGLSALVPLLLCNFHLRPLHTYSFGCGPLLPLLQFQMCEDNCLSWLALDCRSSRACLLPRLCVSAPSKPFFFERRKQVLREQAMPQSLLVFSPQIFPLFSAAIMLSLEIGCMRGCLFPQPGWITYTISTASHPACIQYVSLPSMPQSLTQVYKITKVYMSRTRFVSQAQQNKRRYVCILLSLLSFRAYMRHA